MPWFHRKLSGETMVELVISGEVSPTELQQATSATIQFTRDYGTNCFLLTAREMSVTASTSLFDILTIPAVQFVEEGADKAGRMAIHVSGSPGAKEVLQFFENACVNRGWRVRMFGDRQEALDWMMSDNPEIPL